MKKFANSIRFMLATLSVIMLSQAAVLAEGTTHAAPGEGLTAMQVAGAFALLLLVILIPLVKSRKAVTYK